MNALSQDWLDVGTVADIPRLGSRVIRTPSGDIALFRTGEDEVFALNDKCPHKGGPLSQGIVHGKAVTCPLHNWVIGLETGEAQGADKGCAHRIPIKISEGRILLPARALLRKAG